MTSPDEIREELVKVNSLAMTARRLLAGGKLVDLTALEERVRALCDAVQGLCDAVQGMPPEDGKDLVEDMQGLIGRLDQLTRELEERLAAYGGPSDQG
jgi:hypothetical protein